jgi:hypothetical protein
MCEAKRNQSAKTDCRCKRVPTHGGLTRAALDSAVGVRRTLFAAPCERVQLPTHGGLTPAALDSAVGVRRTLFAAPCKRDRLPNHGGLTPAALGNVRLYSANIVFHSERTSCDQERLA